MEWPFQKNQQWSRNTETIDADLATVHGGDQSEMYAADHTSGNDASLRQCTVCLQTNATGALERASALTEHLITGGIAGLATDPHNVAGTHSGVYDNSGVCGSGRTLTVCLKTVAKSPRSLPKSESHGIPRPAQGDRFAQRRQEQRQATRGSGLTL